MNFIADLTARDFGGYQAVLATHAEGSLEAEKLQMAQSYDAGRAREYVARLAGLTGASRPAIRSPRQRSSREVPCRHQPDCPCRADAGEWFRRYGATRTLALRWAGTVRDPVGDDCRPRS